MLGSLQVAKCACLVLPSQPLAPSVLLRVSMAPYALPAPQHGQWHEQGTFSWSWPLSLAKSGCCSSIESKSFVSKGVQQTLLVYRLLLNFRGGCLQFTIMKKWINLVETLLLPPSEPMSLVSNKNLTIATSPLISCATLTIVTNHCGCKWLIARLGTAGTTYLSLVGKDHWMGLKICIRSRS